MPGQPVIDTRPPDEQRAWWLAQATIALAKYGFDGAEVAWLGHTHNAVFSVMHAARRYSLRLSAQSAATRQRWQSEAMLLSYLHAHTDLIAPQPIAGTDGALYQAWAAQPFAVQSLLFRFVAGENRTPATLTTDDVRRIGIFLGRLHTRLAAFQPDADFVRPALDAAGLFTDAGLYPLSDEAVRLFSPQQRSVMAAVAEAVRGTMAQLGTDQDDYGLIHGDFLLHNILFHAADDAAADDETRVRALDFEYCGYGYYLYDFTPLLWQLKPHADYAAFEQALWEGYTAVRPLTQQQRGLLETFIAGRQVASLRWVAANQHNPHYVGKVGDIIARRVGELQGFLDTGRLRRS